MSEGPTGVRRTSATPRISEDPVRVLRWLTSGGREFDLRASVLGVASAIRGLVKAVFDALHAFSQSRYGLFERFKSALSVRRERRDVWAADASVVRCHAETPCC